MYDSLKKFNEKFYTGMKIGASHDWKYDEGHWHETKVSPDKWIFQYNSIKTRAHQAPLNTGASINTKYHWYIIGDQIATKLDENSYMTNMKGVKFKIGHKRPHWKSFSYEYPEQKTYNEQVIAILEAILKDLKSKRTEVNKFVF